MEKKGVTPAQEERRIFKEGKVASPLSLRTSWLGLSPTQTKSTFQDDVIDREYLGKRREDNSKGGVC